MYGEYDKNKMISQRTTEFRRFPLPVSFLLASLFSSRESDLEEYGRKEASLSLRDILPLNPKQYDKHRAPKFLGQPTIVYFHVTVLSLDSINEESMVISQTREADGTHV